MLYPLNYEKEIAQYLEIAWFSDISLLLKFDQHQILNRMIYNLLGFEDKNNFAYGLGGFIEKSAIMVTKIKNLGGPEA